MKCHLKAIAPLQLSYVIDDSLGNWRQERVFPESHSLQSRQGLALRAHDFCFGLVPLSCCELSHPIVGLPLLPLSHLHHGKALWVAARDQNQIYFQFF